MASKQLILAGGGHTHALVLKSWAMRPEHRPKGEIIVVSSNSASLYSGMVPAYVSGLDSKRKISIDIRWLAQQAKVAFVKAEITAVDPQGQIELKGRPSINFDFLSLNLGAITDRKSFKQSIPIKPLESALSAIAAQDNDSQNKNAEPFHIVGTGLAAIELAFALRKRWPKRILQLHCHQHQLHRVVELRLAKANIEICYESAPDSLNTILCTGSIAPELLKKSGFPCDRNGRIITTDTLQVIGHSRLLAVGDCAVINANERPASGVWAVRAAVPLGRNLERLSENKKPLPWKPQQRALQLLGLPTPRQPASASMLWGPFWLGPNPWLWKWKRYLDRRFIQRLQPDESMTQKGASDAMACRGCAAKVPSTVLEQALKQCNEARLGQQPEDAAQLGSTCGGTILLASVDGFPALVSDPWLNGRLTALHACSDLWASGGRVNSAQAIVTLPAIDEKQQVSILSQTLAGVRSALHEQEAELIGGHTMESRQTSNHPSALDLQLSLSVTGCTTTSQGPWRKGPVRPGDLLLLSRKIGSGVLFAGAMQGRCDPDQLDSALQELSTSQHNRLEELLEIQSNHREAISACTDVTGFGLLGHLNEMLNASENLTATLWIDQIPSFAGSKELLAEGIASTLAPSNRQALANLGSRVKAIRNNQDISTKLELALEGLIVDPQTCGPLMVSCSELAAKHLQAQGWILIGKF